MVGRRDDKREREREMVGGRDGKREREEKGYIYRERGRNRVSWEERETWRVS